MAARAPARLIRVWSVVNVVGRTVMTAEQRDTSWWFAAILVASIVVIVLLCRRWLKLRRRAVAVFVPVEPFGTAPALAANLVPAPVPSGCPRAGLAETAKTPPSAPRVDGGAVLQRHAAPPPARDPVVQVTPVPQVQPQTAEQQQQQQQQQQRPPEPPSGHSVAWERPLTAESPRAECPDKCPIDLWPHQRAMLHACMAVEATRCDAGGGDAHAAQQPIVAALVDPPGAGKTNVVLSLVLADKEPTTTLVVVPHNILTQWQRAAHDIGLRRGVQTIESYAPVANLMFCPEALLDARLVLTTSLYYNSIATALRNRSLPLHRLVLDEIDTIANMLPDGMFARTTWLVSATALENFLTASSTSPTDSEARCAFRRPSANVRVVRCDPEFVAASVPLPEPARRRVVMRNPLVDSVLSAVLTPRELGGVNAHCFSGVQYYDRTPKTAVSSIAGVVAAVLEDGVQSAARLHGRAEHLREKMAHALAPDLQEMQRDLREVEERLAWHQSRVKTVTQRLTEADRCVVCYDELGPSAASGRADDVVVVSACCQNSFCEPCMRKWLELKHTCPVCRTVVQRIVKLHSSGGSGGSGGAAFEAGGALAEDDDMDDRTAALMRERGGDSKVLALEELLLAATPGDRRRRIMVFSDFMETFRPIVAMLEQLDISYVQLDGGNVRALDAAQDAFTSGRADVLLVNSAFYGAGMNLQCASDVVFMHRMTPAMEKQVVGRAQRPGRIGRLGVWWLLHENEAV